MSVDADRVREVFLDALERPPDARAAYVREACAGDEDLRAEVASLLAHHRESALIDEGESRSVLASALTQFEPSASAPIAVPEPPSGARYRTLRELGAGGMGVVVKSFDRSLCRVVATKTPHGGGSQASSSLQWSALLHEARLLAYLDHPGVVRVYDLRADENGLSYTMQLLDGESLAARLATLRGEGRPMPVSEVVRITTRVCEVLANAHAKGVLHLDVKPDNVMLEPFGHVSVIDWGMARFHDPAPYRAQLALAGEVMLDEHLGGVSGGTPVYMPPEQFDPDAELGPAADVYAVGAMLYELLTGRAPFATGEGAPLLLFAKHSGARPVREERPEVSERLGALCGRMLAPDPADRPASVHDVLEELAALTDIGAGAAHVRLAPGEVLFEQGAASTTAYQVVSGELEIVDDDVVVATRHAGDVVGELAMLSRTRRSATVRAKAATVLRAIDWAALEDELSRVDPLVAHLLRKLSDKLIETTSQS